MQTLRGPKPLTYDVFISCSDEIRPGFPGYLYKDLNEKGFSACINHGESIQTCRIFIVILCENYASRLDELVKIMDEYKKGNDRWIFSVFYDVSPSEVRHQNGRCEKFLIPDCMTSQETVNDALRQVADLAGWHLVIDKKKYQYEYIEEIIQVVSDRMACSVGLDRRVEEVIDCLNSGFNDKDNVVSVVGICGDSGMGKSTLARGVSHFDGSMEFGKCFLDKESKYVIKHGHDNSTMLGQKVFLILEDIHDPKVLKAIVELAKSFGNGSRVIITTQDKNLLQSQGIKRIYEVERLDMNEARQFLCLKVCNTLKYDLSYYSILERAATYASGHPFILEVIGSHLRGKDVEECKKALDQYEMIQNHEIQKILQVSFNALEKVHREMLIHIAIHLKERELSEVEKKLVIGYGGCPKKDIKVLIDKGFLKINDRRLVTLHCLTLDMVRYNASREHLCKRGRLPTNILEENMEYSCKFSRLSEDTLEEKMEYHKQEILPSSNNGSMIKDPMEL